MTEQVVFDGWPFGHCVEIIIIEKLKINGQEEPILKNKKDAVEEKHILSVLQLVSPSLVL